MPFAGDRKFGDDDAIVGGFGRFRGESICVIGHEKGSTTESRLKHNFGMARPEGYRKAVRLMEMADRFDIPVLALVDTAGAYPGIDAEERGQAEAIARSTEACLNLGVPNVAVILGEGGSGGAIAIATANRVLMLEHAIYSVISPEGAASILWRDTSKAQDAATNMKITASDLTGSASSTRIVTEPVGGAHRDPAAAIAATGEAIATALAELQGLDRETVRRQRRDKFLAIGRGLRIEPGRRTRPDCALHGNWAPGNPAEYAGIRRLFPRPRSQFYPSFTVAMLNPGLAFVGRALRTRPLGDNDPTMTARGLPSGRGSSRLNRSPLVRALLASAAIGAAIALAGCNTDGGPLPMSGKATRPLSQKMVAEIESKNMDKESPILVRIFKEESELEVWKQDRTGRFALLKTYPICRWSGELGPKIKEGDRQAPEGFYNITPGQMNPNSQYYLSFDLGYPERLRPRPRPHRRAPDGARRLLVARLLLDDRRADSGNLRARPRRLLRRPEVVPGAGLSVPDDAAELRQASQQSAHGVLEDAQAGQRPFRGHPPRAQGQRLREALRVRRRDADGPTRPLSFSAERQVPGLFRCRRTSSPRCSEKQRQDDVQIAELIRRGTPVAPVRTNADGGMHPVFVAAVKRNQIGVAPQQALSRSARRPAPFRRRCGRRASRSSPTRRS